MNLRPCRFTITVIIAAVEAPALAAAQGAAGLKDIAGRHTRLV